MKWRCILLGGPECGGEVDVNVQPFHKRLFKIISNGAVHRYGSTGKCKRDGKVVLKYEPYRMSEDE